jgi:hypothetical protein
MKEDCQVNIKSYHEGLWGMCGASRRRRHTGGIWWAGVRREVFTWKRLGRGGLRQGCEHLTTKGLGIVQRHAGDGAEDWRHRGMLPELR